jgi:hypothetical protein
MIPKIGQQLEEQSLIVKAQEGFQVRAVNVV